MPTFSYTTTFLPLPYQGKASLYGVEVSLQPNIDGFFGNKEHAEHLNKMGASGWELVATEAVLRAAQASGKLLDENRGCFPVTAGFFLFWKKTT